jgi:hypothetical protein
MPPIQVTESSYREIWRSGELLDGGSSLVVVTGLRAAAVTLVRVFGVLALQAPVGAPQIPSPTLSVVNGFVAVTIVNTALLGNATGWQLDITTNHSITQGLDPTGQGAIYVIGPVTPAPATWPTSVNGVIWCRYVFLDGDTGNDANVGYIDAPLGTQFTLAQAAAVAIKTTSRLDQLRPLEGLGRLMQVLVAPRAGNAAYDYVLPSDGLGSDNRRLLNGYTMMHLRGSDLTNNDVDLLQLGFVTAHAGPNVDGSFNILSTTSVAEGRVIQLNGTFPTGAALTKCRLRIASMIGTIYAPIRWSSILNNNVVDMDLTAWYVPGPLNNGDKVWIETPGVKLATFIDARSYTQNVGLNMSCGVLAGVNITSNCNAGALDGGTTTEFCGVVVNGAFTSNGPSARATSTSVYVGSPAPAPFIFSNLGMITNGIAFLGHSLNLTCGGHIDSAAPGSIQVDALTATQSQLAAVSISGCATAGVLNNINYGQLSLDPRADISLEFMRGVTVWSPRIAAIPGGNPGDVWRMGTSISLASIYNLRIVAEGSEPNSPGIVLYAGVYITTFNFRDNFGTNALNPGSGVLLYHDPAGAKATLVSYASLVLTGFEIEGGQRVICRLQNVGYPGDLLPCPRGVSMQMIDGVAGTAIPVGLVVTAPGAAAPTRFDLAISTDVANMRVVGVLLANVVQGSIAEPGGYAVVGNDGVMVLRQEAGSARPASGDVLYLSASAAGYTTGVAPMAPMLLLARALPIGPNTLASGDALPSAWMPWQPPLPT